MANKKTVKIENVKIHDLVAILIKLSKDHDSVDLIIDPEGRRVIVDPIYKDGKDPRPSIDVELTDDNIQDLI